MFDVDIEKFELIKENLCNVFTYLENLERLDRKPVFDIKNHKSFYVYEHQIIDLPGVECWADESPTEAWFRVKRLQPTYPPDPSEDLIDWIDLKKDPDKIPALKRTIVVSAIDAEDQMISRQSGNGTIVLNLEDVPEIEHAFDKYVEFKWSPWAEKEKLRRFTISLYEDLFRFQHHSTDQALELVVGIGILRWKKQGENVNYPVITKTVEAVLDPETKTITVYPTERVPKSELEILQHFNIGKIAEIEEQIDGLLMDSEYEISPFIKESFKSVLNFASANIDSKGAYYPDIIKDSDDRSLPDIATNPVVTDTWVLFIRQRKTNFIADDIRRIKEAVNGAMTLPASSEIIVSEPADEIVDRKKKNYRGISSIGFESWASEKDVANVENLYFPKPFNQEQVSIAERIEQADGMVVQGPPGTGKTHTIANIICHFLANGKRVLVTSQKEAQLAVLRDHIPKELRDLTIGLLTSDREGLKLLEQSVRRIASEVSSIDLGSLESEILKLKDHVDVLYERIATIDSKIQELAKNQLSKVPFLKEEIHPKDLAVRIVEGKSQYGWFQDNLGPDESFEPSFDADHIHKLREARKTLGENIIYLQHKYPNPDILMSADEITYVHQNLIQASHVADVIKNGEIPELGIVSSEQMNRLEKALNRAIKAEIVIKDAFQKPWCNNVQQIWRKDVEADEASPVCESLQKLVDDLKEIETVRSAFLNSPIKIPQDSELDEKFKTEVKLRAQSKRSFFGMIGKKSIKEKLDQVTIEGISPSNAEDWQKISDYIGLMLEIRKIVTRWNALRAEFEGPEVSVLGMAAVAELKSICQKISNLRVVEYDFFPSYVETIESLFSGNFNPHVLKIDLNEFQRTISVLKIHKKHNALKAAQNDKNSQLQRLNSFSCPVVKELVNFITTNLGRADISVEEILEKWSSFRTILKILVKQRKQFEAVIEVTNLIEKSGAVKWAQLLRSEPFDDSEINRLPNDWKQAWDWSRCVSYLKQIDGRRNFQKLSIERIQAESDLAKANLKLVEFLTWVQLKKNITGKVSAALRNYLTALQKIGKGTGIRSVRFREDARKAMQIANQAIPCWIMPHWRVSESLPPDIGSFDLVIIDEASQSDAYALPSILRGKKILVVGDDKQVSPSDVARKEADILYLRDKHLKALPYGHLFLPGSSIYDLCNTVFATDVIRLREHFRCVEPIIQFSNKHFYEGELRPVRIPKPSERLDPPLIDMYVPGGYREARSKINKPEARAVISEIARITDDTRFKRRSIGVVSLLGFEQAQYIQNLLLAELGEDKILNHDIKCGDAKYFQGKEADIVMISMVAAGKIQAQTGRIYEQRFNVAASRARDRLYVFRSFDRSVISENDLRARLLDHFSNPSSQSCDEIQELRDLCESDFERDVFDELAGRGYRVRPQVHVGNYRIDMVVEGQEDSRLAVELDGDKYHGIERWLEDISRQRTLERMGWVFWRCWGSNYISDKDECLAELIAKLESLRIEPIGSNSTSLCGVSDHRTVGGIDISIEEELDDYEAADEEALEATPEPAIDIDLDDISANEPDDAIVAEPHENGHQSESYVQINDTVTYAFIDNLEEVKMVQIVRNQSSISEGIIRHTSPIAQTLLGAFIGEIVMVRLPTGAKELQVLDIVKS